MSDEKPVGSFADYIGANGASLETPETMAERLRWGGIGGESLPDDPRRRDAMMIRADREAIAVKCEEMAAEAQREAEAHEAQGIQTAETGAWEAATSHELREARCEGQASAFRAMAAMLRSAK